MSELAAIAKRVVWYQAPDETLGNRKLFLAHVMTYGTLDEIRAVRREWGERCFAEVLDDPPPRDLRSALLGVLESRVRPRS